MRFESKCRLIGGSRYVLIPPDLADYLKLENDVEVLLEEEEKNSKRFITIQRK